MAAARMEYPTESPLPKRSRDMSAALSRRVARDRTIDPSARPSTPVYVRGQGTTVALPLALFARMDYGKVCAQLGLSPSRPRSGKRRTRARG